MPVTDWKARVKAAEDRMAYDLGAPVGARIAVYDDGTGEVVVLVVDGVNDFDGYLPPAFCIDAESGHNVEAADVIAVLLPGADEAAVVAEIERVIA